MKLTIDIDEAEYTTLSKMSEKEKVNELSYYERVIANGIPYDTSGDLISREALKQHIKEIFETEEKIDKKWAMGLKYSIKIIDLAPTVNPYLPISEEVFNKITDAEWELSDSFWITTPSGKKIEFEKKRPQGEWIKWNFKTFGAMGDWEYKCSNCEKVYGGEYNFCPNCGADMRKRGEEE